MKYICTHLCNAIKLPIYLKIPIIDLNVLDSPCFLRGEYIYIVNFGITSSRK